MNTIEYSKLDHFITFSRSCIHGMEELYAVLYAFYKSKDKYHSIPSFSQALALLDPYTEEYFFVKRFGECGFCEELQNLYIMYSKDDFASMILSIKNSSHRAFRKARLNLSATPDSICHLAIKILDIEDNQSVADFCSGTGGFIINAIEENKNANYIGFEVDPNAIAIAKIISEAAGLEYKIEQKNIFSLMKGKKYDRIFSHLPFGLRKSLLEEKYCHEIEEKGLPISSGGMADWIFNYIVADHLKSDGKAVVLMTSGAALNFADRETRKFFVENGLIEAAISLPNNIFLDTRISTVLLVLSHNNKSIRMVDATHYGCDSRIRDKISKGDVLSIIEDLTKNSDHSKEITIDIASDKDYILDPKRYLYSAPEYSEFVKLEDVLLDITRGAPFTSNELDGLVTGVKSNYRYLQLNNINDGVVDEDLLYISEVPERFKKYIAKPGDIILSKMNIPAKVTVIENDQTDLLVSSNLFIIRVDQEKISPYYIKAFLETEAGSKALSMISAGTRVTVIPVRDLAKLRIPIVDSEKQKAIAQESLVSMEEIRLLKGRLKKVKATAANLFEGVL